MAAPGDIIKLHNGYFKGKTGQIIKIMNIAENSLITVQVDNEVMTLRNPMIEILEKEIKL